MNFGIGLWIFGSVCYFSKFSCYSIDITEHRISISLKYLVLQSIIFKSHVKSCFIQKLSICSKNCFFWRILWNLIITIFVLYTHLLDVDFEKILMKRIKKTNSLYKIFALLVCFITEWNDKSVPSKWDPILVLNSHRLI